MSTAPAEGYRKPPNIWDLKPKRKREETADSSDNTANNGTSRLKDVVGSWFEGDKDVGGGSWFTNEPAKEKTITSPTRTVDGARRSRRSELPISPARKEAVTTRAAKTENPKVPVDESSDVDGALTSPRHSRRSELPISPAKKEPVTTRAAKRKSSGTLQSDNPKRVDTVPDDESSDADSDAPMLNRGARRASKAKVTPATTRRQETVDLTESTDDDDDAGEAKPKTRGHSADDDDDDAGSSSRMAKSKPRGQSADDVGSGSRRTKSKQRGQSADDDDVGSGSLGAKSMSVDKEVVLDAVFSMKPKKRPQPVGNHGSSSSAQPRRRDREESVSGKRRRESQSPDHNPYAKKKFARSKPQYESTQQFTRRGRSESPIEETKLTRQQIIDLENAAQKVSIGHRAFRDGTLTEKQLWNMRNALHLIPFLPVNALHRNTVTSVLKHLRESSNLQIPSDILLDATYILNRWLHNDDFDPDLLRGINKTKRIATRLDANGNPRGKKTVTSSSLEEGYRWRKNPRIRGHNDLVIGQWWPLQICCLRDGAHGVLEGGIAADSDGITVSIIISGGTKSPNLTYEDEDLLNTIHYCGTRGDKATPDPDAKQPQPGIPSNATKSMIRALETRKEVRVIRSSKSREKGVQNYAPAEGFRYDGLYQVVARECLDVEHAMWRFRLERCAGQPEVRWCGEGVKPTSEERHRWGDVKDLWKNVV
ncbi:hypothetical protein K440DRAFT_620472 [Wilcoxina mikolae CBS 423.85]|nr:hypothetical protein K440DRAFT_620472 [Wilcoxina mikolae CBS 423.85]